MILYYNRLGQIWGFLVQVWIFILDFRTISGPNCITQKIYANSLFQYSSLQALYTVTLNICKYGHKLTANSETATIHSIFALHFYLLMYSLQWSWLTDSDRTLYHSCYCIVILYSTIPTRWLRAISCPLAHLSFRLPHCKCL